MSKREAEAAADEGKATKTAKTEGEWAGFHPKVAEQLQRLGGKVLRAPPETPRSVEFECIVKNEDEEDVTVKLTVPEATIRVLEDVEVNYHLDSDPVTRRPCRGGHVLEWGLPAGIEAVSNHADPTLFPAASMFGNESDAWQTMFDLGDAAANEEGDPYVVCIDHELWFSEDEYDRMRLSEFLAELKLVPQEFKNDSDWEEEEAPPK